MALLTITVRRDTGSGRTVIDVGLRTSEEVMPHEHEVLHGRCVAGLMPGAAAEREHPAHEPVVG